MNITINGIHTEYIANIHHVDKLAANGVINNLFHDSDYKVVISDVGRTLLQQELLQKEQQQNLSHNFFYNNLLNYENESSKLLNGVYQQIFT